jgi:hypothetical protein
LKEKLKYWIGWSENLWRRVCVGFVWLRKWDRDREFRMCYWKTGIEKETRQWRWVACSLFRGNLFWIWFDFDWLLQSLQMVSLFFVVSSSCSCTLFLLLPFPQLLVLPPTISANFFSGSYSRFEFEISSSCFKKFQLV